MSIPKPCALVALTILLLAGVPAAAAVAAAPETPDTTFAASANAAGELAGGVGVAEFTPVQISEDGRYVAFQSAAQNLGEAGPPGVVEGFVKDLATGAVELVSRADGPDGEPAGEPGVTTLELSGDGRFVVFTSAATNLGTALPEEEAGEAHVYRRDLETGETTLVDRVSGAGGQILAHGAEGDSISADGSVVAFTDRVANLESAIGDHAETGEPISYVRDLETGVTTAVGRADGASGELADSEAFDPALSPDGRFVTFTSRATNLGGGSSEYQQVYVRDIEAATTTLISQNALGEPGDLSTYGGNLSGGAGCYGELESTATNLLEPRQSGIEGSEVYVFDRCADPGALELVSVQENGKLFPVSLGTYQAAAVTADGGEAVFAGQPGLNCGCHVYVRDLAAATTNTVDRASGASGALANEGVQYFAVNANGCRVAFSTTATNLVAEEAPDPEEEPTEIYVRQLAPCVSEETTPPPSDEDGGGGDLPPAGGSTAGPVPVGPAGPAPTVGAATNVYVGHLGRQVVWLVFDGAGRERVVVQKQDTRGHRGWRKVKALVATAGAAGPVKVNLPRLSPGHYRLQLRLLGDPGNPVSFKRLTVKRAGHP